jgi:hypothetical protein
VQIVDAALVVDHRAIGGVEEDGNDHLPGEGTPMVAVVLLVGTFCLSIFSTGMRRLRQFCCTVVDALLTNQMKFP